MDTINYAYKGKTYKVSPTVLDNNGFFHAAFGIRTAEDDPYLDKKAKSRRLRWASLLTYFESEAIPSPLADVLNKCLAANSKYEHASVEDQDCVEDYISDVTKAEQGITVEEIPVLAALENIKIVLLINGRSDPLIINPDRGILGNYSSNEHFKGEVLLCVDGNVFSRLNLIEEEFTRSLEGAAAEVNEDEAITEQLGTGWKKYKKGGGNAGSEGVQFQVGLLTVFFLNALRKLSNWRLSTENTDAGKFDDVVLEWPNGATLLQAKHKQSKTKKITLYDLTSPNCNNDDFSLPKYFLSFEEIKKAFPLANLIVCTNASMAGEAMRFLDAKAVPFESMLHCDDNKCIVYTFKDNILPYLKDGVKSYYEKNPRNKDVEVSTIITNENIKDFLQRLQFYSEYPAGNAIEKVVEQLLSHLKSSNSPYGEMTPLEIHTKILNWFQQKQGLYLTEFIAKTIFSEICTDRVWRELKRYDVFFRENLTLQTSNRIFHVIAEGGLHLLQELRIFRALQQDTINILYTNADDDIALQIQTVDSFELPKYTILVIVWPKIVEESVREEISRKLDYIFSKSTDKKVILVADPNNTLPQLSLWKAAIINKPSFDDLTNESQEMLLEKRSVVFQGRNVNLRQLLAMPATADYGSFLDSDVLEKIIRGEKIQVGKTPLNLNQDVTTRYISRQFKKTRSLSKPELTFSEETICETNETVILISDAAGTGKSTVLTSLAARIKTTKPHLWVIRINLNSYTNILKEYLEENKETIDIVDLLNSKDSTKFKNHLEKSVFSMRGKVVLMLDGYDEISPDYSNRLVLGLLSVCRDHLNFHKLIVTTRPHMAQELETTLQVKSFVLEPFAPRDQINLLTSYWVHNLQVSNTDKLKCEQYAGALMRRMSSWITSYQQEPFAAIPLHVRMLAEIFQETNRFKDSTDWEGCKEFLTADRLEPKFPDNVNVTRLYEMFVEKKQRAFFDRENPSGNSAVKLTMSNDFEKCLDYHKNLALELILPDGQFKLFSRYVQTPEETNILKIGIVQKIDVVPLFVHRTFSEYFVAESLVEELKLPNRNVRFQKLLIEKILVEWSYKEVRLFFDGFLQHMNDELPSTIFREYQATSPSLFLYPHHSTLLHTFAREGHVASLKLILNCMNSNCLGSNCVDSEFLKRVEKYHKLTNYSYCEINCNVLTFLHACYHLDGLNFTCKLHEYTLLECASEKGRLEIVKFLVGLGADVNAGEYKPPYLAVSGGHLEVLKFLNEQDAELKIIYPTSPAYVAIQKNQKVIAADLLERMLEGADSESKGPLIAYTAAYLGRADVLEEQVRRGLDINSRVEQDETLVFGAVRGEQIEIIRYLVGQGCDVNARMIPIVCPLKEVQTTGLEGRGDTTALHIAAHRNNFELMKVLVDSGADVNLKDETGRTSLHITLRDKVDRNVNMYLGDFSNKLNTIRLLMKNGADVNIKEHNGYNPTDLASFWGRLDAIVLLGPRYQVDVKEIERNKERNFMK